MYNQSVVTKVTFLQRQSSAPTLSSQSNQAEPIQMNSLKCPQCGMVNFTSTPTCKRCKLEFSESLVDEAVSITTDAVAYQFWPPRNEAAAAPEPDWEALSARLRSGLDEPCIEGPASHNFATVFFAICLMLASVGLAWQLRQYLHLGEGGEWAAMTNTKSRLYIPLYEKLYWFEFSYKAGALVMQLVLIWAFFSKSKKFRRLVLFFLTAQFLFAILDAWGTSVFISTMRQKQPGPSAEAALNYVSSTLPFYFVSALIIALWFLYFKTSKRVKEIFIY